MRSNGPTGLGYAPPFVPNVSTATEFSLEQIGILFILMMFLTTIPLWTHALPPMSDYVNHLSRMYVIAHAGEDTPLNHFYELNWQVVPNLAMDLIVPLLAKFTSVYVAGQLFMTLTFVLIGTGTLALNRALFGRWSVVPLVSLPLLYNHVFLIGVLNYMFGIGVALWALVAWVHYAERPWPVRVGIAAALSFVIFFSHLFALGVFGLAAGSFELTRLWLKRRIDVRELLFRGTLCALPFIPAISLLAFSPTMNLAGEILWEPQGKIDGLIYVFDVYYDLVAFGIVGMFAAGATWASGSRLLRVHRYFIVLLVTGGATYLAMPRVLFATWMADQRLPIALIFPLIACIDLQMRTAIVRRAFVALLLLAVATRLCEVSMVWGELSVSTGEFKSSVKRIKPGSKVLVAYADASGGDDARDLGLVHAACLAIIERSALVTTAFTVPGKQVMQVRPEFRDMTDNEDGTPPTVQELLTSLQKTSRSEDEYWKRWPQKFDYVYVLFTDDEAANPDPTHLRIVQEGDRFQLYRVIKDPSQAAAG